MKTKTSAFTLIELLVVISIIAILAALAVPALTSALTKGQMTGTMNNARQVYLAGFQMATDGAANSDPNYAWPGDLNSSTSGSGSGSGASTISSLEEYCNRLVQNDYLKAGDLQKILNAPGANCTVTSANTSGTTTVTLGGKSALKVFKVRDVDASNTIFAVTANYTYNTALDSSQVPYGDKGFVVMRKGGDAAVFKKNQATSANTNNDMTKFQNAIGVLPLQSGSTAPPTAETTTMWLSNPTS